MKLFLFGTTAVLIVGALVLVRRGNTRAATVLAVLGLVAAVVNCLVSG